VITKDRSAVEQLPTRIACTPGGRLDREDSVITNAARLMWRSWSRCPLDPDRALRGRPRTGRRPPGLCDPCGLCVEHSAISGDAFVLSVLPRSVKDVANHQAFGRRMDRGNRDRERRSRSCGARGRGFLSIHTARSAGLPGRSLAYLCSSALSAL